MIGDSKTVTPATVRERFPSLIGAETVFFDNAGGAQVPRDVIARTVEYFESSYAQLGGSYAASERAEVTVAAARSYILDFVGAAPGSEVILGPSTSALCDALAEAHVQTASTARCIRNKIIVCPAGHESNVGPWVRRFAAKEFEILELPLRRATDSAHDSTDWALDLAALEQACDERTRLVVIHHVSNLLGRIEDVTRVADVAHACGAEVVVDGVAFAPHRPVEMASWGVDWYVHSTYKVFGPHAAAMVGTASAFEGLRGRNHRFNPDRGAASFELGGVDHEACAGMLGARDYLSWLAEGDGCFDRQIAKRAGERITELERPLSDAMHGWLEKRQKRLVTVGPRTADVRVRVPTFSFTVPGTASRTIASEANKVGYGIRFGHFYSYWLAQHLGLDPDDGVVRISLVHYNTTEEVERLTDWLDEAFDLA